MIVKIENSKKKNKKYMVTMSNGKTYSFGDINSETYINHKDKIKR